MPTITVDGEKSFTVDTGTKLVLALEDNGIDILDKPAVRRAASKFWTAALLRKAKRNAKHWKSRN
jgi:hypothetical protein